MNSLRQFCEPRCKHGVTGFFYYFVMLSRTILKGDHNVHSVWNAKSVGADTVNSNSPRVTTQRLELKFMFTIKEFTAEAYAL